MSFHIFLNLISEMVALCMPYSKAKSFPCSPLASRSLISKTFSAVNIAPGFMFFAFFSSSRVGQP